MIAVNCEGKKKSTTCQDRKLGFSEDRKFEQDLTK